MAHRSENGASQSAESGQNIAFIRQMLAELRLVAEREKAEMLCYLIEMAYLEAEDVLQTRLRPAPARRS
ncbi:hypothetical protein [Pseudohoeflea coraliihabitans]|uniref:Uncharacterized protein n=1 Tax=Pseudohoeflea coraliihabitans TaxID=2860393 RepID=A0ABS6WT07_9HYPH|nr:hypothetical protein [Pseudohoeflea sp. DP4N28-3]MBW3098915.1 hypothetical protein [Pseudohoeflea sp. DP4N28-3]